MECELTTSDRIIYSCCMIHNLIRSCDHGDFAKDLEAGTSEDSDDGYLDNSSFQYDYIDADNMRGWIAFEMWKEFFTYLNSKAVVRWQTGN
ncbi:TPA: hypothetical protein N0F65_011932 [Lagenidium giganteum]|uniref:Nuclease HARBI1 n=1 Tax=Lagenidium giganteum TaxID=4803 RepID=A0AAV2YUX3_9STRA|nr:TPA: hypothetical protein N0F65_011932 [Lagenidium giganteum]